MTQQEIIEYNRRCAKFLNILYGPDGNKVRIHRIPNVLGTEGLHIENCKFHSDWNWIMEVVEVVEKLGYQFDITGNEAGINSNIKNIRNVISGGNMNSHNEIYYPTIVSVSEEEYSKKQAAVQAINQFLIWYETQSKTT